MSAKIIDWFEEKSKRQSLRNVTRTELFDRALTPKERDELVRLQRAVADWTNAVLASERLMQEYHK